MEEIAMDKKGKPVKPQFDQETIGAKVVGVVNLKDYQRHARDSGSPEYQVAALTSRINSLQGHFQTHKKDNHSLRGLMKMVNKRRRLLSYLKKVDFTRYKDLIGKLELRK
jgi:small subunit ribosomal protein S15